MSSDFTPIRTATSDDIPAIAALVNDAFRVEDFLEGSRTDEQNIRSSMEKGSFFVLEGSANRIAASIYVELRGERAYFGMLAVEPSLQGQGIGGRMIELAETYSREHGCHFMDLTVLSPRKQLPAFYRKLGYSQIGTEAFVPSRPMKAGVECVKILMLKPL